MARMAHVDSRVTPDTVQHSNRVTARHGSDTKTPPQHLNLEIIAAYPLTLIQS